MPFVKSAFWINSIVKLFLKNSQKTGPVKILYQGIYLAEKDFFRYPVILFIKPKDKIPANCFFDGFVQFITNSSFFKIILFIFFQQNSTHFPYFFNIKKILGYVILFLEQAGDYLLIQRIFIEANLFKQFYRSIHISNF